MSEVSKGTSFLRKDDPKYIDLLDEDQPIAGQKYVCLSFISPEKILERKELYFFEQFLKQYDLSKSLEKYTEFLNFVAYKYKLDFDKLTKDLQDFSTTEKDRLYVSTLSDDYKTYIDNHEDSLVESFNKANNFQTSTRGLKVRGCFPSQQEAELRCKLLRELDPNHDILVGPVGVWVPWDPEAYKTGRVEYLEEELNQLMNEKQKNEKAAKVEFDKRLKESRKKAMEDNVEKAKSSGNVLTQTLNESGELVNVKDINSTENALINKDEPVTQEDIKDVLFSGDNVVIDKKTDHGLSMLAEVAEKRAKAAEEAPAEEAPAEEAPDKVD